MSNARNHTHLRHCRAGGLPLPALSTTGKWSTTFQPFSFSWIAPFQFCAIPIPSHPISFRFIPIPLYFFSIPSISISFQFHSIPGWLLFLQHRPCLLLPRLKRNTPVRWGRQKSGPRETKGAGFFSVTGDLGALIGWLHSKMWCKNKVTSMEAYEVCVC